MTDLRVANTLATYTPTVGLAEDVTDTIWKISPTRCPFVSAIRKGTASAMYHEWQKIALNSASATASLLQEGQDIAFDAALEPTRLGNRVEIKGRSSIVSDQSDRAKKYGRKSEAAFQIAMRGEELKTDIEKTVLNNQAKVTMAAGTPAQMAGYASWITLNYSKNDGTLAAGTGADAYTNGTLRTFNESQLKDMLDAVFNSSGDSPDMIIMRAKYKRIMSTFTGNSNRQVDAKGKTLYAAIDVYQGDYGTMSCVADVFAPDNMVLAPNTDHWSLCWFEPMMSEPLARTGLAKKQIVHCSVTLEASNQAASGAVFDLS